MNLDRTESIGARCGHQRRPTIAFSMKVDIGASQHQHLDDEGAGVVAGYEERGDAFVHLVS
jgi:hypothetical protein